MYLSYYNLDIEPFNISTDPKFLWLGEKHKEALAVLKYGVLANKGFLLLTGDVGTGKTTLINALVNELGPEIIVATIHDPSLEKIDFYNYLANAFAIKKRFNSKGAFLQYFSHFLKTAYSSNKKVLLIIDEAQRLTRELLEEIRLLSNIEMQHTKLINIFFVGQIELNDILLEKENRALRQRITLTYHLVSLNDFETRAYIRYRLQVAGSKNKIFNSHAIDEIYSFSGGYPRLINIICDYALLTGYAKEKMTINARMIKECAEELRIPIKSYKKENTRGEFRVGMNQKRTETLLEKVKRFRFVLIVLLTLGLITTAFVYYRAGSDGFVIAKEYWGSVIDSIKNKELAPRSQKSEVQRNKTDSIEIPIDANEQSQQNIQPGSNPLNIPSERELKNDIVLEKKTVIYFAYNSTVLSGDAVAELERLIKTLDQNFNTNIIIKGYTDTTGNYFTNLKLSEKRANVVKAYLIEKGVNPSKIGVFGMGPVEPFEIKDDRKPNQWNRRVEVEVNINTQG